MSFFDSKEEVINIELTQYGKEIFSKGKFLPKYYAFFDEDIIYDTNYAGFSEEQNLIEERILEKSVFSKPIPKLTGSFIEKSIGTSLSTNEFAPAFRLKIIEGATISGSYLSDKYPEVQQIDLNDCYIEIDKNNTLNIKIDSILLELEETNTISTKNNFEISLYEESGDDLVFIASGEEEGNVKDGILLDRQLSLETPQNNPEYAEHYFKFSRDKKINTKKINNLNLNFKNSYK